MYNQHLEIERCVELKSYLVKFQHRNSWNRFLPVPDFRLKYAVRFTCPPSDLRKKKTS